MPPVHLEGSSTGANTQTQSASKTGPLIGAALGPKHIGALASRAGGSTRWVSQRAEAGSTGSHFRRPHGAPALDPYRWTPPHPLAVTPILLQCTPVVHVSSLTLECVQNQQQPRVRVRRDAEADALELAVLGHPVLPILLRCLQPRVGVPKAAHEGLHRGEIVSITAGAGPSAVRGDRVGGGGPEGVMAGRDTVGATLETWPTRWVPCHLVCHVGGAALGPPVRREPRGGRNGCRSAYLDLLVGCLAVLGLEGCCHVPLGAVDPGLRVGIRLDGGTEGGRARDPGSRGGMGLTWPCTLLWSMYSSFAMFQASTRADWAARTCVRRWEVVSIAAGGQLVPLDVRRGWGKGRRGPAGPRLGGTSLAAGLPRRTRRPAPAA